MWPAGSRLIPSKSVSSPDGAWFAIPHAIQQQVWPTEDFELVTSHVESSIPEDDLFAGIRDEAAGAA